MKKILIISSDVIDTNMAGVGVRYWEIAHALAKTCHVTLAIPNSTNLSSTTVQLICFDREKSDLSELGRQADVIIIQGFTLHFHPYLVNLNVPLAVDLYVPYLLESLVWHDRDNWDTWKPAYEEYLRVQLEILRAGDFFFCASERQRDYWLGWLHAQKRINLHTYHDDPSCRKLIDVVPFGIPDALPPKHLPVLKGIHPGIPLDSRLILWSGGLWDWLDPLTLIRAVADLAVRHPDIRLYFMGSQSPSPVVTNMIMTTSAIQLSKDLGVYNRIVFFGDWVPYQERSQYLQEADLGVVTHVDHIETHFSFRTRVLDCIWTGLPVISTCGDTLAEMLERTGVGFCVPPDDIAALSNGIETRLYGNQPKISEKAWESLRQLYRWENVIKPLINFCQNPAKAPDQGIYLTEVERISRDKDAFLQKVILDKDTFLEQVIREKDAFLEQVVREKDAFLDQVVREKDAFLESVSQEKDAILEQTLREKDAFLERSVHEKELACEIAIREKSLDFEKELQAKQAVFDRALSEKDQFIQEILSQRDQARNTLERIERKPLVRIYRSVARFLRRR